jgi:hypothetical protein
MKTLKYILGKDECQYIIFIKEDRLHFELNRCHCERRVAITHIPNLAHFSSKKNNSIFSFHTTLLPNSRTNVKESVRKRKSESKGAENHLSSEFAK